MNDKKYCSACMNYRSEEGGRYIVTKKKRWQCATCAAGANTSRFASKKTQQRWEQERLERLA